MWFAVLPQSPLRCRGRGCQAGQAAARFELQEIDIGNAVDRVVVMEMAVYGFSETIARGGHVIALALFVYLIGRRRSADAGCLLTHRCGQRAAGLGYVAVGKGRMIPLINILSMASRSGMPLESRTKAGWEIFPCPSPRPTGGTPSTVSPESSVAIVIQVINDTAIGSAGEIIQ